jgi:hypothetical protein
MNTLIINAIITTLMNYLTYLYLDKFENMNCDCNFDSRIHILKNMINIFHLLTVFKIVYKNEIPNSVIYFVMILILFFDITFYLFLRKLITDKCKCQKNVTQILYTYYLLLFFMMIFTITFSILYFSSKIFIIKL